MASSAGRVRCKRRAGGLGRRSRTPTRAESGVSGKIFLTPPPTTAATRRVSCSSTAKGLKNQAELAVAPRLLESLSRIRQILLREEPRNESFYSKMDDGDRSGGIVRAAGRGPGAAGVAIDTITLDEQARGRRGRTGRIGARASAPGQGRPQRHPRSISDWNRQDSRHRAQTPSR